MQFCSSCLLLRSPCREVREPEWNMTSLWFLCSFLPCAVSTELTFSVLCMTPHFMFITPSCSQIILLDCLEFPSFGPALGTPSQETPEPGTNLSRDLQELSLPYFPVRWMCISLTQHCVDLPGDSLNTDFFTYTWFHHCFSSPFICSDNSSLFTLICDVTITALRGLRDAVVKKGNLKEIEEGGETVSVARPPY